MVKRFEDARADHRKRYEFAAERLKGRLVLDIACGCGYGSWKLHQAGNEVIGVDIEPEAITWAREYFKGPLFVLHDAQRFSATFDALVSFETLEHLEDPEWLLTVPVKHLIASVPNEEGYPFSKERFAGDKYPHKRHYTPAQFEELLTRAGFKITGRFSQQDKRGEISEGTQGMFLIFTGER